VPTTSLRILPSVRCLPSERIHRSVTTSQAPTARHAERARTAWSRDSRSLRLALRDARKRRQDGPELRRRAARAKDPAHEWRGRCGQLSGSVHRLQARFSPPSGAVFTGELHRIPAGPDARQQPISKRSMCRSKWPNAKSAAHTFRFITVSTEYSSTMVGLLAGGRLRVTVAGAGRPLKSLVPNFPGLMTGRCPTCHRKSHCRLLPTGHGVRIAWLTLNRSRRHGAHDF
jgi:hypothetical protein